MVLLKKSSIFGKAWQKRSLFNILNRKEYFLHTKSEVSKPSKNSTFSNRLVPGFFFFKKFAFYHEKIVF